MREYAFEVRETTVRTAFVKADSAREARQKLNQWAASNGADGEDVSLGDYDSDGFTFRSVCPPSLDSGDQ